MRQAKFGTGLSLDDNARPFVSRDSCRADIYFEIITKGLAHISVFRKASGPSRPLAVPAHHVRDRAPRHNWRQAGRGVSFSLRKLAALARACAHARAMQELRFGMKVGYLQTARWTRWPTFCSLKFTKSCRPKEKKELIN